MLEFNIPTWLFFAAAGLPALFMVGLIIRLTSVKRSIRGIKIQRDTFDIADHPEPFGTRIDHALLEQHIDGVFNALAAVLETERIKLKALLKPSWSSVHTPSAPAAPQVRPAAQDVSETAPFADMPIGHKIAALTEQGLKPAQVAVRLGISQTEVALALRMNANQRLPAGPKMQAVA